MPRSAPHPPAFRERLWPSVGTWLVVPVLGTMAAVALLPVGPTAAVVATVVVTALTIASLVVMSPEVVVTAEELRAGRARVPLVVLGDLSVHRGPEGRAERGPRLDARAFLVIRGWVDPVVRVGLRDPLDPTPYWVVSTRRPEELVEAVETARSAQAG